MAPQGSSLLDRPLQPHAASPVMVNGPDAHDLVKVGPRVVLRTGAADYRMWYEAVPGANRASVGYATSTDGVTWTKQGEVLQPSEEWEGGPRGEVSPNCILLEDAVYKMWYHSADDDGPAGRRRIGYATSTDGLSWTKHPEPVLDLGRAGSFDDKILAEPRVFHVGDTYVMFYWAENASGRQCVARATSSDGLRWTKHPKPVLSATQPWEKGNVASPGVVHDDGVFHMWYSVGLNHGIGYAWSKDGLSWTKADANPVFPKGSDSVSAYRDANEYRILYGHFDFTRQPAIRGIGMAVLALQDGGKR